MAVEHATGAAPPGPVEAPRSGQGGRRSPVGLAVAVVAVLAVAAFVVYAVAVAQHKSAQPVTASSNVIVYHPSHPLPDFTLRRLGGGAAVTEAALRGGPAVVNFFASWCTACQAELGTFAAAARAQGNRLRVLGVDENDSDPAKALVLLHDAHAGYAVGVAPGVDLATLFGVGDLPSTVFIGTNGRIVGEVLGKLPRSELDHLMTLDERGRALTS